MPHINAVDRTAIVEGATNLDDNLMTYPPKYGTGTPSRKVHGTIYSDDPRSGHYLARPECSFFIVQRGGLAGFSMDVSENRRLWNAVFDVCGSHWRLTELEHHRAAFF
jgi:hypothetical protein